MGRRNQQHIIKISRLENGVIKTQDIICSSMDEATNVIKQFGEHNIRIYNLADVLVHSSNEHLLIEESIVELPEVIEEIKVEISQVDLENNPELIGEVEIGEEIIVPTEAIIPKPEPKMKEIAPKKVAAKKPVAKKAVK